MVSLGFGSNTDKVIRLRGRRFSSLLEEVHDAGRTRRREAIRSWTDFVCVCFDHFQAGIGGEVPIESADVARLIDSRFLSELSVGGTAARAALILGRLGVPALLHATIINEWIRGVFADLPVEVVSAQAEEADSESYPHFIIEFSKGETIRLRGTAFVCPHSNRLILPYDPINRFLAINPCFFEQAVRSSSIVLSGFNAMVDEDLIRERVELVARNMRKLKATGVKPSIFLEDGAYHRPSLKRQIITTLGPIVDFFSMNQDELVDTVALLGGGPQRGRIDSGQSATGLLHDAASFIRGRLGVPTVIVHFGGGALLCGKDAREPAIVEAVRTGMDVAATRVRLGRDGSWRDIYATQSIPLRREANSLVDVNMPNHDTTVLASREVSCEMATIGLGDSFVAGFQLALARSKEASS